MITFVSLEQLNAQSIRAYSDLIEEIKTEGFRADRPILIAKTGYRVLDGNRRVKTLLALTPAERAFALSEFNGLVPCIRRTE